MNRKCWIALNEAGEPMCWDDDDTMLYVWRTKPLPEDFGLNEGEKIARATLIIHKKRRTP